MKNCSTFPSLGWKLMISLGQNETFYTYTYPYRKYFLGKTCYGGRHGANNKDLESCANKEQLRILLNLP